MAHHPHSARSAWTQLLVLPAAVCLIFASILVGYASNFLPGHPGHVRASTSVSPGQNGDDTGDNSDDPVADYKAAMTLLKKDYYGAQIDSKKTRTLTYEAIRGMLASLHDQFTSFLDPDEWSQFHATTRGDFEGIGAFLEADGLYVKITTPIEGGPAEKMGLKADDMIVSVNGKSIRGKDINDVVHLIKGKTGTQVLLGVMRDKKTLTFAVTRSLVEPPIVEYWMEDKQAKIGHIVLKEFNEKSVEQLDHAYKALEQQDMKALVLDLRYNPGGLLEVAIQVASMFIPRDSNPPLNNVVVYIREGSGSEQGRQLDSSMHTHKDIPLAVLVNDNSASASEIVSGAIKDYGAGTLIGGRTFGKGKVQTLFPLDDNSALRLTTALYFPPKRADINFKRDEDGNRIPGTGGIVPDIEVKQSPKWKAEDFKDKTDDVQLQKAIAFLHAKLNGMTTAQATNLVHNSQ